MAFKSCFLCVCILGSAFSGSSGQAHAANRYIQILRDETNIRTAPSTQSATLGKAREGDVFELEGEVGRWYQIHLFSGEPRYVHQTLAEPLLYRPEVPDDVSLRRRIFEGWLTAGQRAQREADERFPSDQDLKKNLEHRHFLEDRYRLQLMHQLQVQPPIYRRIVIEGHQKGW